MIVNKRRLLLLLLFLALALSLAYLLLPVQSRLFYALDDVHHARVEPQGNWSDMVCPLCGMKLERIVIDPAEPQVVDEPWRYAYYCQRDDLFWVASYPGGISSLVWYGPFNAYWRLTNAIAISISVICSVSIIVTIARRKSS